MTVDLLSRIKVGIPTLILDRRSTVNLFFYNLLAKTAAIDSNQNNYTATYSSNTKARPPDIPAAKFLPVLFSTTAIPPVMYSQP